MGREWLFSLIPLTIGVSFLTFGIYGLRYARLLRHHGVNAEARIVRHQVSRNDEGGKFYHPVAAWTDRDGRAHEHSSRFGRGTVGNAFRVGACVMVRYDPGKPDRFEIEGWDMKKMDLFAAVLGSIFTAGTVTVVLVRLLTL
ncbi:DUF3592 domain-containing protein [Streptomyces nojiriensis]|uniref:DUF3592 domain-containing protein n=1 Tax=Streptomyces nojiriensis TaxID=66374 RepID=A0ABQ3SZE0_9ACTN|nr:DUF3592 domain-containing protein [Streptomyces nojiriensis]QTI47034.1 hypothetical protein JYK04_04876 [Streptomyces nojiriensis]GGS19438.1 hypothetical protein GCM10010205_56820 [Streptomyces nojiriensis]GHI73524.1 hypothetical protein Snoj_74420 [Streptomyces nojiriensis]